MAIGLKKNYIKEGGGRAVATAISNQVVKTGLTMKKAFLKGTPGKECSRQRVSYYKR